MSNFEAVLQLKKDNDQSMTLQALFIPQRMRDYSKIRESIEKEMFKALKLSFVHHARVYARV